MRPQPGSSNTEVLAVLVERVTYHNSENGFCVLRAKVRGHRDVVTVVGHAVAIAAGEWITASGDWVNDRTHGQQFKARFLRTSPPTSADGIEKYLSSGMIRGVGPVYAKKLVRAFGEKVFEVIETTPDRLREVDGIGPVRAASILAAWTEQKVVREIMIFLHSHGVGTARAVRIFKTYGSDAIQVMSENPYRLARDIRGIGFKTADAIAMKLGIENTAMIRVRAGISYALTEAMDEGHCGLPTDFRPILDFCLGRTTDPPGAPFVRPMDRPTGISAIDRCTPERHALALCSNGARVIGLVRLYGGAVYRVHLGQAPAASKPFTRPVWIDYNGPGRVPVAV